MSLNQLQLIVAGLACALLYIVFALLRKSGTLNWLPKLPPLPKPRLANFTVLLQRISKRRKKDEEEVVVSPQRLQRLKWTEPEAPQSDEDPVLTDAVSPAKSEQSFPAERFDHYYEDVERRVELILAKVEAGHLSITEFEQCIRLDMVDVRRDQAELMEWESQCHLPDGQFEKALSSVESAAELLGQCLDWAISLPKT
ncbi:hypothetical protein EB810_14430 [Altererythrobacter sp. FM1]|uniref:hypothetical protein n=1 Tax=Tsuneonella flava TaxID=2055955 RepID=UPI000C80B272|nr:hypothetical protein [Tsuneonella flava]ROT94250.1 hypothetical protein EB810_14430 [Altererythrobacter sp. FM1]